MGEQEKKTAKAPRIEIVLVPDGASNSLAECYLVFHLPDGKPPATVKVDGGPFDFKSAMTQFQEMWSAIGKKYAVPTAQFGMIQPRSPLA